VDIPVRNDNRRTIPNAIGKSIAIFIAYLVSNLPPTKFPSRLENNAKVKVFPDIFVTVPRYSVMKLLILEVAVPINTTVAIELTKEPFFLKRLGLPLQNVWD
jgi:hypothetical protein